MAYRAYSAGLSVPYEDRSFQGTGSRGEEGRIMGTQISVHRSPAFMAGSGIVVDGGHLITRPQLALCSIIDRRA